MKNPDRTIPRATIVGTLVDRGDLHRVDGRRDESGRARRRSRSPPRRLPRRRGRSAATGWPTSSALGAAISAFGALNGWILIAGQLPLAVAKDGVFPRPFARLSRAGLPVTGMVIAGVLSTALIGLNYSQSGSLVALFTKMMLLSTLSTLVPYAFCSLAVFLPGGRRATSLATGHGDRRGAGVRLCVFAIGGAGRRRRLSGVPVDSVRTAGVRVGRDRGKGRGQRVKGRPGQRAGGRGSRAHDGRSGLRSTNSAG